MKTLTLIIILSLNIFSQVIPIDSVRRQDANGVPLLLGQTVTLRGVVTMSEELGTPLVYFQDPTGGMVGYDAAFWSGTNAGDSVQVTGVVTQYNGLTELQPVTSFSILATNIPFQPQLVTTTNIRVNGENYEGELIRINTITRVRNISTGQFVTTWNAVSPGSNFRIFSGGDSCELRVYAVTNLVNSAIPDTFDVIALSSQFDSSPPYSSGYQILPRSTSDVIPRTTNPSGPILSSITYTNILQNGVTVTWQTSTASNSKVRWQRADSNYQVISYTDSVSDASNVTNHSINITGLISGKIYYFNVSSTDGSGTSTSTLQYFCTQSTSAGTINVYFNRSVDTTLSSGENAIGNYNFQTKLLQRINASQYSIDMALYNFSDFTQVKDALINAKLRGVKIRLVYDNRTNSPIINDIIAAGIPMLKRTNTSGLMHNKFFVFDYRFGTSATDDWVWTGSTNVTNAQFYNDANNVIEIQDQTLAAIYTREFEEMWGSATETPIASRAKFGSNKTNNVPHITNVNGVRIEPYFSPGDNGSATIQNLINANFDYDCYFSIYVFTDYNISNRMKARYNPSLNRYVKGVFDADTGLGTSVYIEMKGYGPYAWNPPADVWIDFAEGYIFHHKYMLIDPLHTSSNPVVETGSYNYSGAANTDNDENFLIVYNARVANLYVQEWYKRYKISGGLAVIGLSQISSEVPAVFSLKQNYPNPFNPVTNIVYSLPKSSNVVLKIYDITGRVVQTLVSEYQTAGTYKAEMKALNMASGVYFYTLFADDVKIDSRKMILIK